MQNSDLKTVAFPRLKNAGKCDNKVNPCFPIPVSLRHLRRTMYNVDPPNVDRPQNKASFANSVAPKITMYHFEVYIHILGDYETLYFKLSCSNWNIRMKRKLYQTDPTWSWIEFWWIFGIGFILWERECWDEQNKFMFLTSLSTKTQIGTFFSLCVRRQRKMSLVNSVTPLSIFPFEHQDNRSDFKICNLIWSPLLKQIFGKAKSSWWPLLL